MYKNKDYCINGIIIEYERNGKTKRDTDFAVIFFIPKILRGHVHSTYLKRHYTPTYNLTNPPPVSRKNIFLSRTIFYFSCAVIQPKLRFRQEVPAVVLRLQKSTC